MAISFGLFFLFHHPSRFSRATDTDKCEIINVGSCLSGRDFSNQRVHPPGDRRPRRKITSVGISICVAVAAVVLCRQTAKNNVLLYTNADGNHSSRFFLPGTPCPKKTIDCVTTPCLVNKVAALYIFKYVTYLPLAHTHHHLHYIACLETKKSF